MFPLKNIPTCAINYNSGIDSHFNTLIFSASILLTEKFESFRLMQRAEDLLGFHKL